MTIDPVIKSESIIYEKDNIKITNLRAVFASKTYSISNITSVEAQRIDANGCAPGGLILLGILLILTGLANLKDNWQTLLWGIASLAGGYFMYKSLKPSFVVALTTASGEVKAYTSFDENRIKEMVKALNDAIIQKG